MLRLFYIYKMVSIRHKDSPAIGDSALEPGKEGMTSRVKAACHSQGGAIQATPKPENHQ